LGGSFDDPTAGDEVVDAQVFGEPGNKGDCFGIKVNHDDDVASAGVVGGDVDAYVNAAGRQEKDEGADEREQATNRHEVEDSCW
jgi:hypothetical protein